MHRGRIDVGVNKNIATQHYLTCSEKVVWGLWVLGLREEHTSLEPEMTCQAHYRLMEITTIVGSITGRSHPSIFWAYILNLGHMSD